MSRVVKLEELCLPDQIGKYGIPAVAEEFSEDKVRYLRITDIDDYGNLLENDKKSVSSPEIEKYILKEGDIVFARTGNSTGRTYYHEEKNGELAFAGFLIKFSLDESKVNPKYLKYFTISKPYKQWVDNLSNGSTRGNINAKTFADCPIILPSREQQDYLVRVLSSLEDKIQINNQINQELEVMAKTLYDYWFVQFDFPDQNGKPYKSSGGKMVYNPELKREIPEGWGVEKLSHFLTIKNGKDHKHLQDGKFAVYGSGGIMRTVTDYLYSGESILFPRKGTLNNVMYVNEKFWTVDTMFYSEVNKNNSALYVFYSVKNIDFNKLNTGTGVPSMTSSILYDLNIIVPEENILEKFNTIVKRNYETIKLNNIQNQELTQLRDWLLPMLMNGQVKVER